MKENIKYLIIALAIILSALILGLFSYEGVNVLGQYIEQGLRSGRIAP